MPARRAAHGRNGALLAIFIAASAEQGAGEDLGVFGWRLETIWAHLKEKVKKKYVGSETTPYIY